MMLELHELEKVDALETTYTGNDGRSLPTSETQGLSLKHIISPPELLTITDIADDFLR
ncbi:unnamed protein product, partial [Rotaria sp. Silwood1]